MAFRRRQEPARSPEDQLVADLVATVPGVLPGAVARRVDGRTVAVDLPDGRRATLSLDAQFPEGASDDGEARAERIARLLAPLAEGPPPATWEDAAGRVRPALRHASWVHEADREGVAHRPVLPHLVQTVAVDAGSSMTYLRRDQVESWGGLDAIEARAAENLEASGFVARGFGEHGPFVVAEPDGYASSWLLLPAAVHRMAQHVPGELLALAPARDGMFLFGADDPAAAQLLAVGLQSFAEEPRRLSPVPYLITPDGVQEWSPPAPHPLRPAVAAARAALARSA